MADLFSKCWCDKSKFYYQLHYNFRVKISKQPIQQPIHPTVKKTTKPFNLVITGIDSLSHAHAISISYSCAYISTHPVTYTAAYPVAHPVTNSFMVALHCFTSPKVVCGVAIWVG